MAIIYTHTAEGKEVLEILRYSISTAGMEVYLCESCEELFGGRPELVGERPECGICQMEREAHIKAEYPNEHEYDPELDD